MVDQGAKGLSPDGARRIWRVSRGLAVRSIAMLRLAASCSSAVPGGGATPATSVVASPVPPSVTVAPSPASALAVPTPPNVSATVSMAEHFFDPGLLTVKVGTTVTWRNMGQQVHDVNARDGSFHSGLLGPGGAFSYKFTTSGRYPYFCAPHEGDGMLGEV